MIPDLTQKETYAPGTDRNTTIMTFTSEEGESHIKEIFEQITRSSSTKKDYIKLRNIGTFTARFNPQLLRRNFEDRTITIFGQLCDDDVWAMVEVTFLTDRNEGEPIELQVTCHYGDHSSTNIPMHSF